ncbi:hypothetical protein BH09PSE2_BH09PSE2_13860 [soil metagenome]
MNYWDREETARLRNVHQLAAVNVLLALRRRELKYRESQTRWPKGTAASGKVAGGRFADEGGGAARQAGGAVARQALNAAIANPEAVAALGVGAVAGGAVAGVGMVGVSRAAGWDSRLGGGGVTPFLGQPLHLEMSSPPSSRSSLSYDERQKLWGDDCDDQEIEDRAKCDKVVGRSNRAICYQTAFERYVQCMKGGPEKVTVRLYTN